MLRKFLFIVAGISVLAYIAVATLSFIDKRDLSKIQLASYPSDATVSINGSPATTQRDFYLEPGTYTAVFSREGFSTETVRIDTSIDGDYPILASLTAESEGAIAWEEDNISDREQFENLSSTILNSRGDDMREKYPIIQHLPEQNNLYSIGYITNDDQTITVTIHAPDVYVPYAINNIKQWDIDPVDYDIDFVNQRNIFDDEQ